MTTLNENQDKHENQDRQRRPRRASRALVTPTDAVVVTAPASASLSVTPPSAADGEIESLAQPQSDPPTPPEVLKTLEQELADYKKSCQEQHDRYTSHLWDQRSNSQTEADKLVVTLAGASLALSVSFLKDVVPLAHSALLPMLFLSWISLGVSLTSTLVSYHLNLENVNEHLRQCKAYFLDGNENAFDEVMRKTRWTEVCNKVSASTFVGGLVLTLVFIGTNVEKEHNQMSQDKATQTAKLAQPKDGKPADPNMAPFSQTPPAPPPLPKSPSASTTAKPSGGNKKGEKS